MSLLPPEDETAAPEPASATVSLTTDQKVTVGVWAAIAASATIAVSLLVAGAMDRNNTEELEDRIELLEAQAASQYEESWADDRMMSGDMMGDMDMDADSMMGGDRLDSDYMDQGPGMDDYMDGMNQGGMRGLFPEGKDQWGMGDMTDPFSGGKDLWGMGDMNMEDMDMDDFWGFLAMLMMLMSISDEDLDPGMGMEDMDECQMMDESGRCADLW